ncbi:MAG: hypothetical protein WCT29_03020 [Candidatus Paceibacterota bacterium]|jgi:hypothetical protein
MESDNKNKKVIVETYSSDIAEVIENDREGLVKKIITAEEQRENEKKNLSPESRKNKMLIIVSVLLLVLGVGILAFFIARRGPQAIELGPEFVPLVFTDKSSFIETAGLKSIDVVHSIVNQVKNSTVKPGGIEGMYLTQDKQVVGLRKFVALVGSNFIPGDNEVFVSDNFLLGVVKNSVASEADQSNGFFILLKARSAEDIFTPLKNWEEKMFADIYQLYGRSISEENKYLLTKNFEDGIVENKNARILTDSEGNLVMMYVYADNNSVVITDSRQAAREIILRLASKQTKE